jgi:putative oxidoreductase
MNSKDIRGIAERAEPFAFALLRFIAGAMLAFHGVQKIVGWYAGGFSPPFGSQLWVGGVIELVGGSLVALGLFTRPAAFLVSGMMAVAYFQFHWKLALGQGMWLPAINKGELAAIYCFVFLFIASHGGGLLSLDSLVRQRRGRVTDPHDRHHDTHAGAAAHV